jgi:hypothetical protein
MRRRRVGRQRMRLGGGHGKARWLKGLAVVAAAGVASFFLVWHADLAPKREGTPNDIIASRFPAEWGAKVPLSVAAFALANAKKPEILANTSALDWLSSPLVFDQARLGLASLPPYMTPNPRLPAGADVVIPRPRPDQEATLFTEGQIASIKERLRLSPDQEKMWPAVEAALRAIAWRGSSEKLSHKTATLDPKSLEKMTTVLGPFLKKLRADQKDELRTIAHVMGLEQLASQL